MFTTAVLFSDKYAWALRPFVRQFDKYWAFQPGEAPVSLFGFSPPPFPLTPNYQFTSLGLMRDFPVERWTDGLLELVEQIPTPTFLLMLEDYWLVRPVNLRAIRMLAGFLEEHPEFLQINVTSDKMYQRETLEYGYLGSLDLLESEPEARYHLSLQAGLWRKDNLKRLLMALPEPMTPWQFEMEALAKTGWQYPSPRVLGTRQVPMRYVIGIRNGEPGLSGSWQYPKTEFTKEDRRELEALLNEQKVTV